MEIQETGINGLVVVTPKVFGDNRGYFKETFSAINYATAGIDCTFVQDNQSFSNKGVTRGLHFQTGNSAQAKLVSVVRGAVLDVVVDIRIGSPTYGKPYAVELTEDNHKQFFVPIGFAHGFAVLEDKTLFTYKCSNYYDPSSERTLQWNDPALKIDWPFADPILSEKDQDNPTLAQLEEYFKF